MPSAQKRARRTRAKPAPPKRRAGFTNIYARWIASEAAWCWRPALKSSGSLVWGPSFRSQKEAFEAFLRMRAAAQQAEARPTSDLTLGQAFSETIARLRDEGGSEVTARGYRGRFKRWEEFMDPEAFAAEVTTEDIRALIRKRREKHGVGSNGIVQDLRVLHRVFAVAGIPPNQNPARKRTTHDPSGIAWPEEKQPDRPFFRMENIADIEHRIRSSGNPAADFHADVVVFLAVTGLRSFEFSRLRSVDVDYDSKVGGGVLKVQGKRGGIRRVAFSSGDEDLVRRVTERAQDGPVLTPGGLATILKRWSKVLALPLSARTLRRTFATDMADGADLRTVQTQMGHSQLTTTQKYLGERPELARSAAERRHRRLRGQA